MKINRKQETEVELDITAFMNLMIVLVPVLLMSMVFKQITILELNIPDLSGGVSNSPNAKKQLEVVIRESGFEVYYPSGRLIKKIPVLDKSTNVAVEVAVEVTGGAGVQSLSVQDYKMLSETLQEVKRQLGKKSKDKRDVLLLLDGDVSYQTLVSTMDTVRSFKTVVAANLVEAELFPEISLGDAPKQKKGA